MQTTHRRPRRRLLHRPLTRVLATAALLAVGCGDDNQSSPDLAVADMTAHGEFCGLTCCPNDLHQPCSTTNAVCNTNAQCSWHYTCQSGTWVFTYASGCDMATPTD